MKKLFILLTPFLIIIASISIVHAQTPVILPSSTNTTTVVSDYAKDVRNGEKGTANDVEAKNNQKDIADNENIEAQEETEAVEPIEKIEPKEAVEPQEAVENESEGDKSGGGTSFEGSIQKSDEQQPGTNNTSETQKSNK